MVTITPNAEGVSHCDCGGGHFQIAYLDNNLKFFGFNAGRLSTKGVIEYADTEAECRIRVEELDLNDEYGLIS